MQHSLDDKKWEMRALHQHRMLHATELAASSIQSQRIGQGVDSQEACSEVSIEKKKKNIIHQPDNQEAMNVMRSAQFGEYVLTSGSLTGFLSQHARFFCRAMTKIDD